MPTLAVYLQGKHWTSAVLTPVSVAADGVTTDVTASAATLTTKVSSNSKALSMRTANVTPVNQVLAAYIKEEDDWEISVEYLLTNDTDDPNLPYLLRGSYDIFKLVTVEGTATGSTVTYTFYGIMEQVSDGIQGKSGNSAQFTLKSVGVAPTRAVA